MLSTGTLKAFNLVLGHIDEEGQIRRISPETNYTSKLELNDCLFIFIWIHFTLSQFKEHEFHLFESLFFSDIGGKLEWLSKSS